MKRYKNPIGTYVAAVLLALMLSVGFSMPKAQAQYGNDIGYQDFYDDLAPHGQWFNDPQYGYVWTPNNVGRDFRPYYTNGNWAMTDYGNMWMSNYAWGWAPFHYGRWAMTNYGWVWIPGNEWGPAWVTWRQGGGYYGWAPMGPGISINISFGNNYYAPDPWWTFVPYGQIYNNRFHRYHNPRRNNTYIHNTTIVNNTYYDNRSRNTYVTGPRRNEVERSTGRKVNVYQVNNRSRAGRSEQSGRAVSVYRPSVRTNDKSARQAVPRAVKQVDATNRNKQGTTVRQQPAGKTVSPATRSVNRSSDNKRVVPSNKAATEQSSRQRAVQQQERSQQQRQQAQRQQVERRETAERQQAAQKQQRETTQRQQVQQGERQQAAQRQQRAAPQRQQRAERQQAVQRQQSQQQVQRSQPQRKESVAPQRAQKSDAGSRSSTNRTERARSGNRGGR